MNFLKKSISRKFKVRDFCYTKNFSVHILSESVLLNRI